MLPFQEELRNIYHHIEGSIAVFLIVSEYIFGIKFNFEVVSNQSDFMLKKRTVVQ